MGDNYNLDVFSVIQELEATENIKQEIKEQVETPKLDQVTPNKPMEGK